MNNNPNNNTKLLVGVVAGILLVAGVAYAVTRDQPDTATTTASPTPAPISSPSPGTSPSSDSNKAKAATTIMYDASGFAPTTITVTAGQSVTFTNSSDHEVDVSSSPHPAHTDNPELNAGVLAPGKSVVKVLNNKGSFGIHNHLNPTERMKITIQ